MVKPAIRFFLTFALSFAVVPNAIATPAPGSLGAAMSTATANGPIVAVGVDGVQLAAGSAAPPKTAAASAIAAAYGYGTHAFASAIAIGPDKLVAIPDPPADNSIATMDDAQRLTLFAVSLSADQWDLFRGDSGIGLSDISSDAVAALFRSFFRPGTVVALVNFNPNEAVPLPQLLRGVPEITPGSFLTNDEIENARLRLGVRPEVYLPLRPGASVSGTLPPLSPSKPAYIDVRVADGGLSYLLVHTGRDEAVPPAADRPNDPNRSDLPATAPWSSRLMTIRSGETVADVMQTLRTTGGPEIYADPRYEKRPVTIAGKPAPIATIDMLRAIAFAVGGVYRKIGDVYLLTADLTGDQVRWIAWADTQRALDRQHNDLIARTRETINSPRVVGDLTALWSSIALSPDQQASLQDENSQFPDTVYFNFLALTPSQQDYARRAATKLNGLVGKNVYDEKAEVLLKQRPYLQAIVPGTQAPVEIDTGASLAQVFGPMVTVASDIPPPPPLSTSMSAFKRRVAIVAIGDPTTVGDLVSAAETLTLNELWVEVSKPADVDVFDNVLSAAKDYGIKVYAYVDTLDWGAGAPSPLKDLTATGQTPVDGGVGFVAPVIDDVKTGALDRLHAAVACSSGIVIGSTQPPGYENLPPTSALQVDTQLGYTIAARQSFIRKAHADPIDILPPVKEPFDTLLRTDRDQAIDDALYVHWNTYRASLADAVLKSLLAGIPKTAPAVPVLIERLDSSSRDFVFAPAVPTDAQPPAFIVPETDVDDAGKMSVFLAGKRLSADWAGFAIDLRHSDALPTLNKLADSR